MHDVIPATVAGELGLLRGDRILEINGAPVSAIEDLDAVVAAISPGMWISVKWQRADKTCAGKAVLGAYHRVGGIAASGGAAMKTLEFSLEPGVELRFYWEEYQSKSVKFKVLDPAERELMSSSGEAEYEGYFPAISSGVYRLEFDNKFSRITSKVVDLYYQIRRTNP